MYRSKYYKDPKVLIFDFKQVLKKKIIRSESDDKTSIWLTDVLINTQKTTFFFNPR